jgi:hypothetical protein
MHQVDDEHAKWVEAERSQFLDKLILRVDGG